MSGGDEAMIAAAVRGGDPGAFSLLYGRYRPLVFSVAWRITGDTDVAEDVVQETFLQVSQALAAWRPEAKLSTWIYRIAVNAAIDERRRARRRPAAGPVPDRAVEHAVPDRAVGDRISRAVSSLPPRERAVFVLRHYEDLPLAEVADVLGIALGTVKATLHHAVAKLAESLKDLR